MSSPIRVYFVRDMHFVGMGIGNLGFIPNDMNIPTAIFDAWHCAVEYFGESPDSDMSPATRERWTTNHGHLFSSREALFGYQHVVIPSLNLIISRQIVHDLLTQKLSTVQFLENIKDPAFTVNDEAFEQIASNTEHRKKDALQALNNS